MSEVTRADGRAASQLRPLRFQNHIAPHAAGSTLVAAGNTRIICAVTVEETVPRWMKEQKVEGGWLTAEYSMLPYSTLERKPRDISKGKLDGRSSEIQRLIGRAIRAAVDLNKFGARTICVDCDVLQADGGTRTAAITGAFVAVHDALAWMRSKGMIGSLPVKDFVAAVSVGLYEGAAVLDLDYAEDSACQTDMNVVMTGAGRFVEVQGTAEGEPFARAELDRLLAIAGRGIAELVAHQRRVLGL